MQPTSRRKFLRGVTAVAGGAIATSPIAIQAGEERCSLSPKDCSFRGIVFGPDEKPQKCDNPSSDEIAKFLPVIVAAWTDPAYRKRLLTFTEGDAVDWRWYSAQERTDMLQRTNLALKEKGVDLSGSYPVVLSQEQLDRGVFWKNHEKERVLRLPQPKFPLNRGKETKVDTGYITTLIDGSDGNICGM